MLPCGACGYQHGKKFSHGEAQHSDGDGGCFSGGKVRGRDYVHTAYPHGLFQQLGSGWNAGFFDAVKVSVCAGVYGAEGDGKGEDAQHSGGARLLQKQCGDGVCQLIHRKAANYRQGEGNAQPHGQRTEGRTSFPRRLFRYKLGNGGLVTGGGQGEGEGQHRA